MALVKFETAGAMRKLVKDGFEMSLANRKVTVNLSPGETIIHWFAKGDPGDEYGLTATLVSDGSVLKSKKGTLESTKAGGLMVIEL